jgi:hypothetical protein
MATLKSALHGNYISNFPGLSKQTLNRHPPNLTATVKGRLNRVRKNKQSTKKKIKQEIREADKAEAAAAPEQAEHLFPEPDETETHHCYVTLEEFTSKAYSNQTGKFPVPSISGNTQVFVLYHYDGNRIFMEPMKGKSKESMLQAYSKVYKRIQKAGLRVDLQYLDNECSTLISEFLESQGATKQLVPPRNHRSNAAERAIQTAKCHLISGLCTTPTNFPLPIWDKLIPQAELTLNLMRGSRMNPKLSAWAQFDGPYDFNRTPIAPPGMNVLVYVDPDQRGSWGAHAIEGHYVGPALEHYRCYEVYIPST